MANALLQELEGGSGKTVSALIGMSVEPAGTFTAFHSSLVLTTRTPHRISEWPPKYFVPGFAYENHEDEGVGVGVGTTAG